MAFLVFGAGSCLLLADDLWPCIFWQQSIFCRSKANASLQNFCKTKLAPVCHNKIVQPQNEFYCKG